MVRPAISGRGRRYRHREGEDGDIDIETEEPEFSAWKWVAHEDLPRLIVPFKLQLYRAVLAEFTDLFAPRAEG
jgi:putative (di)nucleoside polyphosphate hydrolase